jgi:two-component system, LuxR family, sensor kinase FixL
LIQSLGRISALELGFTPTQNGEVVELTTVLDELRILIENTYHESEIRLRWDIQGPLPSVWADRHGLVQVFLNLARNSQRAMMSTGTKRLRIAAREENEKVLIRFEDTGVGVSSPESLFQPFQRGAKSSGIGLSVFRERSCAVLAAISVLSLAQKGPASLLCCLCALPRRKQ